MDKSKFKIGDLVKLVGGHPWAGEVGKVISFQMVMGKMTARVKLLTDDAMAGHECFIINEKQGVVLNDKN